MKEKINNIGIGRIIFFLLFALIISIYLMSSYYAKYTGGANSDASARVAAFSVTGLGGADSITVESVVPPYSSDYQFSVTSASEVAVEYNITVSFAENIPPWITLLLDGNAGTQSGNTAAFLNAGTFQAGTHTNNHTLTFRANPQTSIATTFSSINVRVDAVQTD